MRTETFNYHYRGLLEEIHRYGEFEINARTGVGIYMLEGGHSFKLDLSDGKLPVAGNRKYFPRVAAAETAWQFLGTQDPDWILKVAPKLWSNFVEDGKLKTAYGYRWREHFGRDQLALAIEELANNPTNRQLYVSAWDPATDGLGTPNQPKNIPCPVGFSVSRIENNIHMSVFIRSSDVFVGLPYDVMGYALTLDAIAASIDCSSGTLHVTLAHPHYYDPHAQFVEDCLIGDHKVWAFPDTIEPDLPYMSMGTIVANPDRYMDLVARLTKDVIQQDWNPLPTLVL